ncbi:uncharacterized protein LOC131663037 [Phymastichus coffea]|uniref:uncharacterized protein LOC131663037 n=1 Tax=Phymastichus coffea TaxID=108790 RepID=UPI00273C924D|nr:uncharacterized protein LOC131663037 [Phymastichus coffea]
MLQWNCRSVGKKYNFFNEAYKYDIILLIETWLDNTKSFKLKGFNTIRFDRKAGEGGGIAILVKENIFYDIAEIEYTGKVFETGSVIVKTNSEKLLIMACYRPQQVNKAQNNLTSGEWNNFIESIINHDSTYFIVGGDFNAHHSLWGSDKHCPNGNIIADNCSIRDCLACKSNKSHQDDKNISLQNKYKKTGHKCIWWNDLCDKVTRQKKAAIKSISYRYTLEKFIEVNRLDANLTKTLREEKKKSFDSFCAKVNPRTRPYDFWRTVHIFNNSFKEIDVQSGNIKTESNMIDLIDELSSPKTIGTNALDDLNNLSGDNGQDNDAKVLDNPFSYEELQYVLNSVNVKSAPGLDKITYEIIAELPEFYQRVLLDLYNDIFHHQTFPEDWNNYLVIFIPKGKSNKVRPISLASCMLKIMEKLIKERLQWWLEKHDVLSPSQFGFRKNKSCIDNLSILTSDIQKNFFTKNTTTALFLDVKGAYNDVVPDIIIDDLIEIGLTKKIIVFIKNLIFERKVTFCTFTKIIEKIVNKGLPQGSVLSCLLYAIYTRKINQIIKKPLAVLEFADDVVVYNNFKSDCVDQVGILEEGVRDVVTLLKNRGLAVARDKCILMVFENSRKRTDEGIELKIDDAIIEPSEDVKFLGMILDRRLTWRKHVDNLIRRCKFSLRILSFLRSTWWGADPRSLLLLYTALIRLKIEYGGFIMSPCNDKLFKKLQKLQNSALRIAMGYMNSTPINVMIAESKIPYLQNRIEFNCLKYILKCMASNQTKIINNLEDIIQLADYFSVHNNFKISLMAKSYDKIWFLRDSIISTQKHMRYTRDYNYLLYKSNIFTDFSKKIPEGEDPNKFFNDMYPVDKNNTYIFTDGSKLDENDKSFVGFASWSKAPEFCISKRILDSASIFTAECSALITVIQRIIEIGHGNYTIFSDSESALKAINSDRCDSPLIIDLKCKLAYAHIVNIDIKLVRIPAHVGVQGNEIVDSLAKDAAKNGVLLDNPIPVSDFFSKYKKEYKKENENLALQLSSTKGTFYFKNFYRDQAKPWFFDLGLPRKAIVSINRIRSNHSSLNSSLFRKDIVLNKNCECNSSEDSVEHIFWECELTHLPRKKLLKEIRKMYKYGPYSAISLLASNDKNVIGAIAEFLEIIKIKV